MPLGEALSMWGRGCGEGSSGVQGNRAVVGGGHGRMRAGGLMGGAGGVGQGAGAASWATAALGGPLVSAGV